MNDNKNRFARVGIPKTSHVFHWTTMMQMVLRGNLARSRIRGRTDEDSRETLPGSAPFPHKITRRSTRNDDISRGGMTKGGRSILGPRSLVGQTAVAETTLVDCLCTKDGWVVADRFLVLSSRPIFDSVTCAISAGRPANDADTFRHPVCTSTARIDATRSLCQS